MLFLKIILIILAIIGVLLSIYYIHEFFYYKKARDKRSNGKRYCNHCMFAYTLPQEDEYKYCPRCGRELDYIKILDDEEEE